MIMYARALYSSTKLKRHAFSEKKKKKKSKKSKKKKKKQSSSDSDSDSSSNSGMYVSYRVRGLYRLGKTCYLHSLLCNNSIIAQFTVH